jgi:lactoylglutathione lyase
MTGRFDHVGLTVADLRAAATWYAAALDLTEDFAFALAEFDFRGVVLRSPTGYRIELIERTGSLPGRSAANPVDAALTRGYSHFALHVDDVDATYDRLLDAGASDRMSPRPAPEPGCRMAFVADPEGNLIELLHRATGGSA